MSRRMIVMVMAGVLAITLGAQAEVTWKQCVPVDEEIDNALMTWAPWSTSWEFDMSDMSDVDSGMYYRDGTVYDNQGMPYKISEAWMKVCAYGVEPSEKVYVEMPYEGDKKVLGCLDPYEDNIKVESVGENNGNNENGDEYSCTYFQLDPKWLANDGGYKTFGARVKGFKLYKPSECATIKEACMKVTYEKIPAPGATLLGVLGLTTVGWIKRKVRG